MTQNAPPPFVPQGAGPAPGPRPAPKPAPAKPAGPGKKPPPKRPPPQVIEVAPIARPARMRARHWGLFVSFILFVLLPVAGAGWYLWTRAIDQYASVMGFTIRQEEGAQTTGLLGGLAAQVTGGGGQADADILYEFIQSTSMVAAIDARFDLHGLYSAPFERDPVFALRPDASLEELTEYWQRIVRIAYDGSSQLIELEVRAFDPNTAQLIGQEILSQSQSLINQLNAQARADTIRYAQSDLAEALINLDLLAQSTNDSDPRVVQAKRRIEVIRVRIRDERANVARGENPGSGEDYPTLLAEYESLLADREFAEETWRAAQAALDLARANAARQSRYLATYIAPTLPHSAQYPQKPMLLSLVALFSLLAWAIMALIYYSIRDSK